MYTIDQQHLLKTYLSTRSLSVDICAPLEREDFVPQPIEQVSPPKWHLAHTTWFFEQFVLLPEMQNYRIFDEQFSFLFNSYYNNLGERTQRSKRGFMSRPTVEQVYQYRQYVDEQMQKLFSNKLSQDILKLIETGIHHEQQHQELLVYDIKYILGNQPLFPAYGKRFTQEEVTQKEMWIEIPAGLFDIGADGKSFCFDNELKRHPVYVQNFKIKNTLETNSAYLAFMEDGGYQNHNLWHDEGWAFIQEHQITSPLYWHFKDGQWMHYNMNGLHPVNPDEAVAHISFYEAAAFAAWAGYRLPTEFEWEVAADKLNRGNLWEWTNSAYMPYPGFQKAPGALGEYNSKFMLNQQVLRGSSVATPPGHSRKTYRNFFHASSRWIFSGVRLAI